MSDIAGMSQSVFRYIIPVYNFLTNHAFQLSLPHRLIFLPVNVGAVLDPVRSVTEPFLTEETDQRYSRLSLQWLRGGALGSVELQNVLGDKLLTTGLTVELQILLGEIFVEILGVVLVHVLLVSSQIFARFESSVTQLTGEYLFGLGFQVESLLVFVEDILREESHTRTVFTGKHKIFQSENLQSQLCLVVPVNLLLVESQLLFSLRFGVTKSTLQELLKSSGQVDVRNVGRDF